MRLIEPCHTERDLTRRDTICHSFGNSVVSEHRSLSAISYQQISAGSPLIPIPFSLFPFFFTQVIYRMEITIGQFAATACLFATRGLFAATGLPFPRYTFVHQSGSSRLLLSPSRLGDCSRLQDLGISYEHNPIKQFAATAFLFATRGLFAATGSRRSMQQHIINQAVRGYCFAVQGLHYANRPHQLAAAGPHSRLWGTSRFIAY